MMFYDTTQGMWRSGLSADDSIGSQFAQGITAVGQAAAQLMQQQAAARLAEERQAAEAALREQAIRMGVPLTTVVATPAVTTTSNALLIGGLLAGGLALFMYLRKK